MEGFPSVWSCRNELHQYCGSARVMDELSPVRSCWIRSLLASQKVGVIHAGSHNVVTRYINSKLAVRQVCAPRCTASPNPKVFSIEYGQVLGLASTGHGSAMQTSD
jgi:hypothetical protein